MTKILFLVAMMLLAPVSITHADQGPVDKLVRGLTNVVTSPFEIPKQIRAYWIEGAQQTDHILVWVASGFVRGIVEDVKRFGSGVWDVVSFPISVPGDYEPLLKPDYVFQEWPSDPDVFIFKRR